MIYSGVDLIRRAEHQSSLHEKLIKEPLKPAGEPQDRESGGEDARSALLRFARSIKKKGKKLAPAPQPYHRQAIALTKHQDIGQMLDIYA